MAKYTRGQHPRSLANLGKPKTKAGRFNFTLSAQSVEWLSRQPNKSAAIDQLIEEKIMSTQSLYPNQAYELFVGVVSPHEFVAPFGGDIEAAIAQLMNERWWESEGGTPAPDNLAELIREYVEGMLDN
jgi:hypothetical protein